MNHMTDDQRARTYRAALELLAYCMASDRRIVEQISLAGRDQLRAANTDPSVSGTAEVRMPFRFDDAGAIITDRTGADLIAYEQGLDLVARGVVQIGAVANRYVPPELLDESTNARRSEMWCRSCHRRGFFRPISTGRYKSYCRDCGEFHAQWKAEPADEFVEALERLGKMPPRVYEAAVRKVITDRKQAKQGKATKQKRRKAS